MNYFNIFLRINLMNLNNFFFINFSTFAHFFTKYYVQFICFLVVYPIIHFSEDRNSLMSVLLDQKELNEHFKLHQGKQLVFISTL